MIDQTVAPRRRLARARDEWHASRWIVIPVVACVAIGVWSIDTVALWSDELVTLDAVTNGLRAHLWEAPLLPYYALVWLWTFGGALASDAWLRMASVVAALVGTVAVACTARRLWSRQSGLAAGLLFALSPAITRYGQEARTYAFGAAAVAVSTFVLFWARDRRLARTWVVYGIALCLGAVVMPITLAVIPAHGILLFQEPRSRGLLRSWLIACGACLPVIAVEAYALAHFSDLHFWLPQPTVLDLPEALVWASYSWGSGLPLGLGTANLAGVGFAIGLLIVGLLSRSGRWFLIATSIVIVGIWVLSFGPMSWWAPRTFVPFVSLPVLAAAASLRRKTPHLYFSVLGVFALMALSVAAADRVPGSRQGDLREAAALVAKNSAPGYSVYFDPAHVRLWYAVRHYEPALQGVEPSDSATGLWWTVGGSPRCSSPVKQWTIAGGETLTLCSGNAPRPADA